jgi:hypothetical protein
MAAWKWSIAARPFSSRVMTPSSAEAFVNLVEFVINCFLPRDVLAVHPFNQLTARLLSLVVRVMAIAEQELAASGRVGADAPATVPPPDLRYTTATRTPRARAPKLCPQCPACHLSAKTSVCHGSTGVVVLPPLHMAMYNFSNTLSARNTRTLCVTTAFKLITARGDGSSCGSCGAFRQTGAAALVLAVSRAAGP